MGWITPVTTHADSDYFTHTDMNRIYGNLEFLYNELSPYFSISPHIDPPSSSTSGEPLASSEGDLVTSSGDSIGVTETVWWTQNDIFTVQDWTVLLGSLKAIADTVSFVFDVEPTTDATAENFNVIESITVELKRRTALVLAQFNGNHWVGDPFYVGDDLYLGGLYGST